MTGRTPPRGTPTGPTLVKGSTKQPSLTARFACPCGYSAQVDFEHSTPRERERFSAVQQWHLANHSEPSGPKDAA
jgi:hypothetical protein